MLKVGVQSAPLLDNGIDEGFKLIHEAGFDCIDFNIDVFLPGGKIIRGELDSIYDQSDDEIREFFRPYKEAAEKYGVSFYQAHAPFPSWVKDQPVTNEHMIQVLEKCIMVCEYLNCGYLIVHPFFASYDGTLEAQEEWDLNIRQYGSLIPACKKHHVTVCLENMFTGRHGKVYAAICQNPDEACRYIDTLNEMAGEKCFAFCLDTWATASSACTSTTTTAVTTCIWLLTWACCTGIASFRACATSAIRARCALKPSTPWTYSTRN